MLTRCLPSRFGQLPWWLQQKTPDRRRARSMLPIMEIGIISALSKSPNLFHRIASMAFYVMPVASDGGLILVRELD
jgi:hypothetical protein